MKLTLVATCLFGLEHLLGEEIDALGCRRIETIDGRVTFEGDISAIARCNMWLRCAERVYINNLPAKPSREVKIGDLITINYGKKALTVKVISLKESTKKIDSELMYEFVSEEMRDLKV